MKTKTIIASLAVSALAFAQPAAAATRSYESIPASGVKASSPARAGAAVGEAESLRGAPVVPIVITFAVLALLILLISDDKSKG